MRDITSAMQTALEANLVRPVVFVECDFDSGAVDLWNGVGSLSYGGKTYIGAGNLLSIDPISESTDLSAKGTRVSLSGLDSSLVTIAKDEDYQGRELTIKLGAMDENNDVIADPVIMFSGFMDTMVLSESGKESVISVTVENKLITMERARVRRFTDNDQKIDHPNDNGFSLVASIQDKQIRWGVRGVSGEQGVGSGDIKDSRRMR